MSRAPDTFACPACRTPIALAQVTSQLAGDATFESLVRLSVPLADLVLQYVALFTPERQSLTQRKQLQLIKQLYPSLEARALTHKGREWPAPLTAWAQGIEQMLAARAAGRLELPMAGHSYLFAIVAGLADKHEAQAEQQRQAERRTGPRAAAAHGPASVGDLLLQPPGAPSTSAVPNVPSTAAASPRPAAPAGTSPTVRAMREQIERSKPKGAQ